MSLRRRYKRKTIAGYLLLGLVFGLLFLNRATDGVISQWLQAALGPVIVHIPQAAAVVESLQGKAALEKKVETLRSRIASLEPLAYQNATLQRENETLRTLLAVQGTSTTPLVMAKKVASAENPYGVLLLLLPEGSSVSNGALVLDRYGFAIGFVRQVRGSVANVTLFSAPGVKTELLLPVTDADEPLLAYGIGRGSENIRIEVPSGTAVAQGELIYGTQTQGHPVAVVQEVQAPPESPLVHVFARTPASLAAQDTFFIVAYAQ